MKDVIKEEHKIRDQLIQVMIDNEWSDMYITVGTFPAIKIGGEIKDIDEWIEKLTWKDTLEFTQSIISDKQHDNLVRDRNLDFSFSFQNRRLRANVSFQMWNYMVVLRLLNSSIPNMDALGLTEIYKDVCKLWQWLILVTGPTWSWKTTTLASMIDFINTNYKKHIITIEDPIEYVHQHKRSIIEQKEIGKDVPDYGTALIWAMRQNPQVILFWEMRNKKEIEAALTLAETGHLVFSTLHTRSAYQTISRIVDTFGSSEKDQIRIQLADAMVGIFSQRLLKVQDGSRVEMVKEVLINNVAIANLIRWNELHQVPTVMQMSSNEWMQLLEKDIVSLIHAWIINEEEWMKYANNPKLIADSL